MKHRQGTEEHRRKSLEAARALAQKAADRYLESYGIFFNSENTAIHRPMRYLTGDNIPEVVEQVHPTVKGGKDRVMCPRCKERAMPKGKVQCSACDSYDRRMR